MLSIVVPVLDEAGQLAATLGPLQALRGLALEIVVVDGVSRDATREIAAALADRVIEAPRGRASQMNAGARLARGGTLLFLHADTRLQADHAAGVEGRLAGCGHVWGRFDVSIEKGGALLAVVA